MLRDSFGSAFKSIWSNKMRSFLTILGIVIGIYAVVTLLSIAQGVQKQTTELVEGFGAETIIIIPGEQTDDAPVNIASQFAPSTLFVDDVAELQKKATLIEPDIEYATFFGGVLRYNDKKINGFPVGITPGAEEMFSVETQSGRGITEEDLEKKNYVITLSKKALEKLSATVGDKASIGTNEFTIVGSFSGEETISIGQSVDDMYFVPATVANIINQSNQVNRIVVKAKQTNEVDKAVEEVKSILRTKHGSNDFTVQKPTDILETFSQITDILTIMVVGIAAISLLVGGIGISNIMLVTVTERTREIGIRKAVGATEGVILLQFLIEAIILTVIGAVIAIAFAGITGAIVAQVSPLEPEFNVEVILLALGMAVVTGVIFGLFPAIRAARKNPVEALRFE